MLFAISPATDLFTLLLPYGPGVFADLVALFESMSLCPRCVYEQVNPSVYAHCVVAFIRRSFGMLEFMGLAFRRYTNHQNQPHWM